MTFDAHKISYLYLSHGHANKKHILWGASKNQSCAACNFLFPLFFCFLFFGILHEHAKLARSVSNHHSSLIKGNLSPNLYHFKYKRLSDSVLHKFILIYENLKEESECRLQQLYS